MIRLLGVGDNVCDKYVHSKMMYPGGQALNVAVYAKQLGAETSYLGVFGRDEVADHIIKTLDEIGVEHGRCRQYDGENGYARVNLVDGDRVFLGSNKGGIVNQHPLELTDEDLSYMKTFDIMHTSNNGHFNHCLKTAFETGVPVSYDFSGQWVNEELVREVAPYASYVFLSCGSVPGEEAKDICSSLFRAGCRFITATRGSKGAMIYDGVNFYEQSPKLVEAVDTLGAGDSFATAFLLSVTESKKQNPGEMKPGTVFYEKALKQAMGAGADFASKTCMVHGAFGYGISFQE